ncbi:hypothetical protein PMIN02_009855 [Paraphaeosphaeria minitans]|uniref:Uncharacterized protein n=1 Tax=Paraphaeosphaeria minitans TaxID=565426 RepID=A0A9P6KVQ5_9PLEO|nr:hypothetical protein PMIN01_02926 [Paraphaeosphaeria minitans]
MSIKVAASTKRKVPAKKVDTKKTETYPARALRSPNTRNRINQAAREKDAFYEAFNTSPPELPAKKVVKKPTKKPVTKVTESSTSSASQSYKGKLDALYLPEWYGVEHWEFAPIRYTAIRYKKNGQWDGDWKKLLLYKFYAREIAYITEDPDFINARYGGLGYEELFKNWMHSPPGAFWETTPRDGGMIIRNDRVKENGYERSNVEENVNDDSLSRRREIMFLEAASQGYEIK